MAGSMAGLVAISSTYPLDLLRARVIVSEQKTSLGKEAKKIIATHGARGLYRGLPAALSASVPKLALSFGVNETVATFLVKQGFEEGALVHIAAGCCAGMVSSSVTFPADVVMRTMQVGKKNYNGVGDAFRGMYKKHGWRVFFKGLAPELLKSVPVQCTALVVNTWALGEMGIKRDWDK